MLIEFIVCYILFFCNVVCLGKNNDLIVVGGVVVYWYEYVFDVVVV